MRRLPIVPWLLGVALCVSLIARTPISTDMSAFLPNHPAPAQRLLVDQLREGVVSRLVLGSIDGAPPAALAAVSRDLAKRLRADPRFTNVANGDPAAFDRERTLMLQYRYLLSPAVTAGHFTEEAMHAALEADIGLLGSDLGVLAKKLLPRDPSGETLRLLDSFEGRARPRTLDGVWMGEDGRNALLSVSTRAAGSDIDGQQAALGAIRAAFAEAQLAVPEAKVASIALTGPPVFAVTTRARIRDDAERLSMVATLLVAAVLLLTYRSGRMLGLGLLPVATGALAGVAAVSAVFGFVHGITLGFGVTLIGEAVDYAIYLFTRTPQGAAPSATLPRIWPTLRLGMLTSVVGFSAMLFSNFTGFAQLGLFTIAGLVTALAVTRFVLPVLLPTAFRSRESTTVARPVLVLIAHGGSLRWVVAAAVALAGLAIALHGGAYWENALSSMSPIPAKEIQLDTRLRGELGAPDVRMLLVVQAPDAEGALVASERAGAHLQTLMAGGALDGFDSPANLLPSQASQRARQQALPLPGLLRDSLTRAVAGTGLRAETFEPFLADVEAARVGDTLTRAALDGTGLAIQVDTLLVRSDGGWRALLPLRHVTDASAIQAAFTGQSDVAVLDLRNESDNLLASYRREALTLALAGSIAIVVLLGAFLRSATRVTAVVAPLAAAVICSAAVLLATGPLSIFNLFGLLLVVAVGSNYALFFEREDTDLARMVASVTLANLCTVIGFATLSLSRVPVLHDIGETVALGAALSLVFGAVISSRRRPA